MKENVIIMGAAGRDFHNFNVFFRNKKQYNVVCFTATQIPNIEKRRYPKKLSGKLYPNGIPIFPEEKLPKLIKKLKVKTVVFSYSDISHEYVMDRASNVLAAGANFMLLGPNQTQLESKRKVISICAVRTGCGKSQTTRYIVEHLQKKNIPFAIIRHPMPYGNLTKQAVQRFASMQDLIKQKCTIEEREEYEPYVSQGIPIFAGVDYQAILKEAEKEAKVILWDGGNNDFSFIKPDLQIVVVDPLRAGHEISFYPGAVNARTADIIIFNKVNAAKKQNIKTVERNLKQCNPKAMIIKADSIVTIDHPNKVKGKSVVVIEDGPTLTHGLMAFGAGIVAAKKYKARKVVDPRPYVVGSIKRIYKAFPHIGKVIPALGYSKEQLKELEKSINKTNADTVIIGTPIDLSTIINIKKPHVRVTYNLKPHGDLLKHIKKILQ